MKKSAVFFIISVMLLGSAAAANAAALGVGARASGMGGVGIATANDATAAYYNPACLSKAGKIFDARAGLGYAHDGLQELTEAFAKASDPADFFVDNFDKKFDAHGSAQGFLGASVMGFGLSAVPSVNLIAQKNAGSFEGTFAGHVRNDMPITFSGPLDMLGLPLIRSHWGANIKFVNEVKGDLTIGSDLPTVEALTEASVGSGVGFDLGAVFSLDIAGLSETSVGVVFRDVLQTINYEKMSRLDTFDNITGTVTKGAESKEKTSETAPMTIGIGAATTIPLSGTLLAADMEIKGGDEGESIMKFGVEQPMMGIAAVRAGMTTGDNSSISFGGGIRAGASFDIAFVIDSRDSRANAMVFEIGAGL